MVASRWVLARVPEAALDVAIELVLEVLNFVNLGGDGTADPLLEDGAVHGCGGIITQEVDNELLVGRLLLGIQRQAAQSKFVAELAVRPGVAFAVVGHREVDQGASAKDVEHRQNLTKQRHGAVSPGCVFNSGKMGRAILSPSILHDAPEER